HGQRRGERRVGPPAFAESEASAEREQPAAADVNKIREHALLLERERAGFHAAEDHASITEQLGRRRRKARLQLLTAVHAEPVVLVGGGALQHDDIDVRIRLHRLQYELHLVSRLAFDVEDALRPVADLNQRVALVVFRDVLARLYGDLEAEHA